MEEESKKTMPDDFMFEGSEKDHSNRYSSESDKEHSLNPDLVDLNMMDLSAENNYYPNIESKDGRTQIPQVQNVNIEQ